ncbi:MAG: 30S ribosomal protein S14 [SAR202 cluster bacterium]|nr:30S ribosomal protein S14 [Chloroflexota bacterium]MQF84017.1 30S ribosomal protein S14 [SAR202 cluster bacterium]MAQ48479.1 30S ribosomal protein S14 [Chloroflexota bacterium]MBS17334.1 30S ribosomal protein S14 [Chloroflexota bacterium]MEC7919460.1 30S ribosomal protein S14 [Chloroflexota bacterium]
MAKKSAIARNKKRIRMVEKYSEIRNELKDIANSSKSSFEEKMEARRKLDLLPKNSSPVRVRNRCQKTGRPRGYMRFFGLSRISMRDLALRGHLPGIRKGSL